jgi:hypothetical protein
VAATFAQSSEYDAFIRGRLLTASRGTLTGRTALEGQVVHVADVASDPEYTLVETVTPRKLGPRSGCRCCVGGVVARLISRGRVQPFTERQIELVRTSPTRR